MSAMRSAVVTYMPSSLLFNWMDCSLPISIPTKMDKVNIDKKKAVCV